MAGISEFNEPLTVNNYRLRFHGLLRLEEEEHEKKLRQRCNKEYKIVFINRIEAPGNSSYFYLDPLDDIEALSLAKEMARKEFLLIVDKVSIAVNQAQDIVMPHDANFNAIPFEMKNDSFTSHIQNKVLENGANSFKANAEFSADLSYFQHMHEALEMLPQEVICKIMGSENSPHGTYARSKHKWNPNDNRKGRQKYQMELDSHQFKILCNALQVPSLPLVVTGSFGTGKTRLLARLAYNVAYEFIGKKVLLVAHHQSSADTLAQYLDFNDHRNRSQSFHNEFKVIRVLKYGSERNSSINGFQEIPVNLLSKAALDGANIVITTIGTSYNLLSKVPETARTGYFSHILIDEAAQIREPEAIIPLCFASSKTKIVVAGDHCQVGPQLLVQGDIPQRCGLAVSLVERLHELFQQRSDAELYLCSLIENYRCVPEILNLISTCYYGSSLLCNLPSSSDHAHAMEFVCSSEDQIVDFGQGVDEAEAAIVIDEVVACRRSNKECDICIISPSPSQCHLLRQMVKQKSLKRVEVLKTYNIQGREFEAVFLSTSEMIRGSMPCNHTRSPSSHFVFNTLLTRAKYLFVAVGNPFLLLKVESEMMKVFPNSCKSCWTPFLKACIKMESIRCSSFLSGQNIPIQKLIGQHFRSEILETEEIQGYDDILEDYSKVYDEEQSGSSYLGTSRTTEDFTNDSCTSQDLEKSELNGVKCKLKAISKNMFHARPFHDSKEVIHICGYENRIGAFDRDTVIVRIFNEDSDPPFGKVLRAVRREENPNFLCVMSPHNSDLFYPVDELNPGLLNCPLGKRGMEEFKQEGVKIYDSSSINCGNLVYIHCREKPTCKWIMPYSHALKHVFQVQYVQWNEKHHFPIGIVTNAWCKGYDLEKAERLLSILYLKHCDSNEVCCHHNDELNSARMQQNSITSTSSQGDSEILDAALHTQQSEQIINAFTIDPIHANVLDDALSLRKVEESDGGEYFLCEVGVHVVNFPKYVPHDSADDKMARRRGTDVYKEHGDLKSSMLSRTLRKRLSLDPNKIRHVWSLICKIRVNLNTLKITIIERATIRPAIIKSLLKLSYDEAQRILNDLPAIQNVQAFDEANNIPLNTVLKILYSFSLYRAGERLKCDEKYYAEDRNGQNYSCWQAHKLVEELMIWFNSEVATELSRRYNSGVLVRRQPPPEVEKIDELDEICQSHSLHSLGFSNFRSIDKLVVPSSTIKMLEGACQEDDATKFSGLVMTSALYPQISVAKSKWKTIQKPAETCYTEVGRPQDFYHHYSLNLNWYSFFTSPLRRYTDVIVQRLFANMTEGEVMINYDIEYFKCTIQSSNNFEKKMMEVKTALSVATKNDSCTACIECRTRKNITFHFLNSSLSSLSRSLREAKIAYFGPFKPKSLDLSSSSVKTIVTSFTWEIQITSMKDYIDLSFDGVVVQEFIGYKKTSEPDIELYEQDRDKLIKHSYSSSIKPLGVTVDATDWQGALELMQNPAKGNTEMMKKILSHLKYNITNKTNLKKTVKFNGIQYPYFKYNLELPLREADMFKVWIGMTRRKFLLEPTIQLVELSPLFRVCLKHNAFPAQCFSKLHLKPASQPEYRNTEEYTNLWKFVVLAETAVSSVSESRPVIIRDVKLVWPKLIRSIIDGATKFIVNNEVEINITAEFGRNAYEFCTIRKGDLICARYGYADDASTKCVFHFVVNKVDMKEKVACKIHMMICQMEKELSQEIRDTIINAEQCYCEIQVINVNVAHRRIYEALISINERSNLCRKVALSNIAVTPLESRTELEILQNDDLALRKWDNEGIELNDSQKNAIRRAVQEEFLLIRGPPGTGKSVVGAHLAYIFAKRNELKRRSRKKVGKPPFVLYCGPSNKSVDVVFEKIIDLLNSKKTIGFKVLRIYGRMTESKDHPYIPIVPYVRKSSSYRCPEWGLEYALHTLIRDRRSREPAIMEFIAKDDTLKEIYRTTEPSASFIREYRDLQNKAESVVLSRYFDIVFCTCSEVSGVRLKKIGQPKDCIMDEAGMATEPESIAPISYCSHVVLIGDNFQLQPVIQYKKAKFAGLTISLFERYARYHPQFISHLTTQYRMHKNICAFPSMEFYGGGLDTPECVLNRDCAQANLGAFWPKGVEFPIVFCNVIGKEEEAVTGSIDGTPVGIGSKFNHKEAAKAVEIVRNLHRRHRILLNEIAILTPYSAQKKIIENEVKDWGSDLTVATISESQGDEYGFVILSTVRSKSEDDMSNIHQQHYERKWLYDNLGFLIDRHQINVAITRGKYGLVIIGNQKMLSFDKTWEKLLQHYETNGCLLDQAHFP